jgi:hypothetical protein
LLQGPDWLSDVGTWRLDLATDPPVGFEFHASGYFDTITTIKVSALNLEWQHQKLFFDRLSSGDQIKIDNTSGQAYGVYNVSNVSYSAVGNGTFTITVSYVEGSGHIQFLGYDQTTFRISIYKKGTATLGKYVVQMGGRYPGTTIALGTWYGASAYGPWSDANMLTLYDTDPNPLVPVGTVAHLAVSAGNVKKVVVRYTVNPVTVDGEIAVYHFGCYDSSSLVEPTKLASVNLGATKVDSLAECYIDEISLTHAVTAGSFFGLFAKHTTVGATLFITASVQIEET